MHAEYFFHPDRCTLFDCTTRACSCGATSAKEVEVADAASAQASAHPEIGKRRPGMGTVRALRQVVERGDAAELHFLVQGHGRGESHGSSCRRRQARFREESGTINAGRSPTDDTGLRNGYLLAHQAEEENFFPPLRSTDGIDGAAVRFFRERGMRFWADTGRTGDRVPEGSDLFPTRNLASSQVACVNVMLPLASSSAALTAAMRAVDPEFIEPVAIEHEVQRSLVELEWIGPNVSLEGRRTRGANSTSIDALVLGRVATGIRAYLMEWKYVEEGGDTAKGEGDSGRQRIDRYLPLYQRCGLFSAPFESLLFEPVYQLMRFTLLGQRMVDGRELGVTDFRLVLVCPHTNFAYRKLEPSNVERLGGYGTLADAMCKHVLKPEHAHLFSDVAQIELIEAVRRAGVPGFDAWASYVSRRYGW